MKGIVKILISTFVLVVSVDFVLAETKWHSFKAGKGEIIFAYSGDWKFWSDQKPRSLGSYASLTIANPAASDTSDSSNLSIFIFDLSDKKEKYMAKKVKAAFDLNDLKTLNYMLGKMIVYPDKQRKRKDGWEFKNGKGLKTLYAQKNRKPTEYRVREAYKKIKGNAIYVKAEWPRLPNNSSQYDEQMETNFLFLVNSIKYQERNK